MIRKSARGRADAAVRGGVRCDRDPARHLPRARAGVQRQDFIALQKSSFAPFLKDLAFKWHAGQVMLDLVLITVCYYVAYRLRFDGESLDTFMPYFTATLPVVLGCKLAGAVRVGALSALLGNVRPARSRRGRCAASASGRCCTRCRPPVPLSLGRVLARRASSSTRCCCRLPIIATRVSFRMMNLVASTRNKRSRRVLVYGAGAFGQLLVREMRANPRLAA